MHVGKGARLAFMLHAPDGIELETFFEQLTLRCDSLAALAESFDARLRVGTKYPLELGGSSEPGQERRTEPIEGAVEFSVPEERLGDLVAHASQMGALLADIADTERSIVTVGPMYHVVDPKPGDIFLALTFRREPGTTLEHLHTWWLNQHPVVVVPFQLPEMLAYDQVHVDHGLSEQASIDAGFAYRDYDSYDNLTWANIDECMRSISKPGSGEAIYADEVGNLDHMSYVGALMNRVR